MIEFDVDSIKGKARPEFRRSGNKVHAYDSKNKEPERLIREAFLKASRSYKTPLEGAIGVEISTYKRLPKSKPKKILSEPDTFKPDIDNIIKLVFDALNGVAYDDDKQIVKVQAKKFPRRRIEKDKLHVKIYRLDGYELD